MTTPDPNVLLTTDQVAAMLQVTPRTIRRWALEGILPRLRVGGRLTRYRAADVLKAIEDQSPP